MLKTLYAEASVGYFKTSVSSTSFHLSALEARFGAYLMQGVAVELYAATGLNEDTQDDIDLSLDYSGPSAGTL